MSNNIGKTNKRLKREKEDRVTADMMAIRELINRQVTKTFQVLITTQFIQLKKDYEKITYEAINYLLIKLIEGVQEEENKELFEALAKVNYSEGNGTGIKIDIDSFNGFVELAKGYVTVERCLEILNTYDEKAVKLNTIVDAVKIANENATGESYEVVTK